jgi:amidase
MPNRADLEARTRTVARLGRLLPSRALSKALARETAIAASINAVFDKADVLLTPLCASPAPRLADCPSAGARRSLRAANTSAWLVPWNVTGQPGIAIPIGVGDDNLPTAVQLAGRPNDEATLLAVAAEIEKNRSFARWTPEARSGWADLNMS